jgi:hypothetical protein
MKTLILALMLTIAGISSSLVLTQAATADGYSGGGGKSGPGPTNVEDIVR